MVGRKAEGWRRDAIAGTRESRAISAALGRDARETRKRRGLSIAALADRIAVSRTWLGELERGLGAGAPLSTWVKLGNALGRPLAVGFSRDIHAEPGPVDAGHLAAQELVLRFARQHGGRGTAERATRPNNPTAWADVMLRDDRLRTLFLVEIVNRSGNLGDDLRTTDRKRVELRELAVLAGGGGRPFEVAAGWLVVDTAANRALVGRFGELLRSRFPGSSAAWARALNDGTEPPSEPAIAWIDTRAGRIRPLRWRHRGVIGRT